MHLLITRATDVFHRRDQRSVSFGGAHDSKRVPAVCVRLTGIS